MLHYPTLSYRELEYAQANASASVLKLDANLYRVDRVFVPEMQAHPSGYFKNEWVIELYSPRQSVQLYFSVRPQQCGVVFAPARTFKPSKLATRSGFDLNLNKNIVGTKLISLNAIPNERILRLDFSGTENFSLYLILIPAQPEAVLCRQSDVLTSTKQRETFALPAARTLTPEQLEKIPFRKELLTSQAHYLHLWMQAQNASALALRRQRLSQLLSAQREAFARKEKSLNDQLEQSKNEPDWNYFGSLLQTHFYSQPKPQQNVYVLEDYEKNETVQIPADPKLNLKQQLERYFHLAKRNRTRLEEASQRTQSIREKITQTDALLARTMAATAVADLELIEKEMGMGADAGAGKANATKDQKRISGFSGRQVLSKEGLTILAGRNLAENLELTFKIARGNDLWFHVKGRPGSHTVVLLPPKRSASLDTLLDAAHLCIIYSGGKDWGKTEVDYTFRKHVKKIKNHTEVSYTQNKTLSIAIDAERLKRLADLA